MLNLTTLANKVTLANYGTYIVTDLIKRDYQADIAASYPEKHFKEFSLSQQSGNEQIAGDFKFKFEFFTLQNTEQKFLKEMGFTATWIQFLQMLTSKEYSQQLGKAVGIDLEDTTSLIEFARYRPGDWLDAHYDKQSHKVLTQMFYFNMTWNSSWGGYFHVLNPQLIEETVIAIPPLINYSIIVEPKPNAWHRVEKVNSASLQPRVNLVLEFYKK